MYKEIILGKTFYFESPATAQKIEKLLLPAIDSAIENDCVCSLELSVIVDQINSIDWFKLNKRFSGYIKVNQKGTICN